MICQAQNKLKETPLTKFKTLKLVKKAKTAAMQHAWSITACNI